MTLDALLQQLHDFPLSAAIRENNAAFPSIESLHVLAITLVFGTISVVDLRLIGYPAHRRGARRLITDLLPFTWGAFVLAVVSGGLMFTSNAVAYAHNAQFQWKMLTILAAGGNMAFFHLTAYQRIIYWDDALPPPLAAKVAGSTSLALWVLAIFFGRWVGFTLSAFS